MAPLLGIDLGGTKIEGVLLDGSQELARYRLPTPAGDYRTTLATIVAVVNHLEAAHGVHCPALGIGTPGALSRVTGRMKNCNSVCLNGQDLRGDLQQALGKTVHLANDADCFTLSEAVDGAAAGADIVFGVILGTGVGGGIVANGRLLCGPNGITGEWGHNPLPAAALALAREHDIPSRTCYCGRADCVEAWLSGPGLARTGQALGAVGQGAAGLSAAAAGDPPSAVALALHARQLALALAQVINILDPEVIVLGGGVSNLPSLYRDVPPYWQGPVFSDCIDTRLVQARYGDSSGVRGAAWLSAGQA